MTRPKQPRSDARAGERRNAVSPAVSNAGERRQDADTRAPIESSARPKRRKRRPRFVL